MFCISFPLCGIRTCGMKEICLVKLDNWFAHLQNGGMFISRTIILSRCSLSTSCGYIAYLARCLQSIEAGKTKELPQPRQVSIEALGFHTHCTSGICPR